MRAMIFELEVIERRHENICKALGNRAAAEDRQKFPDGQVMFGHDEEPVSDVGHIAIVTSTGLPVFIWLAGTLQHSGLIQVINDEVHVREVLSQVPEEVLVSFDERTVGLL